MDCLSSRVAARAQAAPDQVAIVDGDREVSYGQFLDQVQNFGAALIARGLQRGDRVAIVLPNRIEAAVACYGTWLAGGVAVPFNAQARLRDFASWLRHCGAHVVVHERGHVDIEQALSEAASTHAIGLDAAQSFVAEDTAHRDPLPVTSDPAAPAAILYTSGTTGAPKGVMLSHANLLANVDSVLAYLQLESNDSVLSVLPFYYAYGASVLHTHLVSGSTLRLAPNLLFPHLIVEALVRDRVTGFSGVPSTFALLLDRVNLADYDLSGLRYLTQAGGAMSPALTRRLRSALPQARLFVMYGQTEATSRLTWLPPERLDEKIGSVGIAVRDVQLEIRRDDGACAALGETGDVWACGPNVMAGYWQDPDATAAVLRDGWLRTGDMGHLDAEGFLTLAGRRSDMIKTGAHRVHPNDIEDAIAELAGVREVAVVGIDDEVLGQVIKAVVVADDLGPRGVDRIKAHCRARLAPYKIPKQVEFVNSLPRTASGKVRRILLTEPQASS